jgi:hypothetical protein
MKTFSGNNPNEKSLFFFSFLLGNDELSTFVSKTLQSDLLGRLSDRESSNPIGLEDYQIEKVAIRSAWKIL